MSVMLSTQPTYRLGQHTIPTSKDEANFALPAKGAKNTSSGSASTIRAQAPQNSGIIEVLVTAPRYEEGTTAKAQAALRLIDLITARLMPGSAVVERVLAGGGESPRSILDQARKELAGALTEETADRSEEKLEDLTTRALEAFENFYPGALARDGQALNATLGLADFVRDSSVTAATALLGPLGGALQASGTALFDRLMPGDSVYEANPVADITNIASTYGAIKAAGWAHRLEPAIVSRIGPLIARMPEAAQGVFAGKIAQAAGEMTLDATLHLLSDTIAETGGRVAQDVLDGRSGGEIARNAREAAFGAGGASLVSTLAVEVLDRKGVLPREQLVMIAETLERVSAKMGVRMAVGRNEDGNDIARKPGYASAAPGSAASMTPREETFAAPFFLRQELTHGIDLGDDVPGLRELRLIHGYATLAERINPEGGRILPERGYMTSEADVATTLALLLERMNPQTAARFIERLEE